LKEVYKKEVEKMEIWMWVALGVVVLALLYYFFVMRKK